MKTANGDVADPSNAKASGDESAANSRIRFRHRRYIKDGSLEEKDAATKTAKPDVSKPPSIKHAMTVLRAFDDAGKYEYTFITIHDDGLQALLLFALSHLPDYRHASAVAFLSLCEPLVHSWSSLSVLADNDQSNPAVAALHEKVHSAGSTSALASLKGPISGLNRATADLKLLLDQVREIPGLEKYFLDARQMQETANTTTFEYLWTIFPPGEVVILRPYMGELQAFIVKTSRSFIHRRQSANENRKWYVECWSYDYNGNSFDRIPVVFTFEEFKGTKSISSLHCYPFKFHRQNSSDSVTADTESGQHQLQETLIRRGKKYRELCLMDRGKQIFDYDGIALSRGTGVRKAAKSNQGEDPDNWSSSGRTSQPDQDEKTLAKKHVIKNDRVMVDFHSYIQHCPSFTTFPPIGDLDFVEDDDGSCRCATCMANDELRGHQKLHYDRATGKETWEDAQYMLCPPRVLGYHLKSKRWVELNVELVTKIENPMDSSSFQNLELAKTKEILIEQLVKCHASGKDDKDRSMTDLMQGKGNGLVILLHGPPGVGKTLTAGNWQTAVFRQRVGHWIEARGSGANLEVLFELAATWRAVMLFDEADVFLESRSSNTSNLDRNALVSILLRVLEYYDGILILTTNRIKTFDIAVQSRVNFAITYKNLDDKQKKKIYTNFVSQLKEENTLDYEQLMTWPESEAWADEPPFRLLNGRQIRNVLFSAASIAQGDPRDKRFSLDHIKKILKETNNFQNDINIMYEKARAEAEVAFEPH